MVKFCWMSWRSNMYLLWREGASICQACIGVNFEYRPGSFTSRPNPKWRGSSTASKLHNVFQTKEPGGTTSIRHLATPASPLGLPRVAKAEPSAASVPAAGCALVLSWSSGDAASASTGSASTFTEIPSGSTPGADRAGSGWCSTAAPDIGCRDRRQKARCNRAVQQHPDMSTATPPPMTSNIEPESKGLSVLSACAASTFSEYDTATKLSEPSSSSPSPSTSNVVITSTVGSEMSLTSMVYGSAPTSSSSLAIASLSCVGEASMILLLADSAFSDAEAASTDVISIV
mmetsp:Transcript_80841/g.203307  ORF Transcript_80841/g.203307 Transcript_80841/m.203307 type:complete len:288 (+) Transcript_80841:617-1480(+)